MKKMEKAKMAAAAIAVAKTRFSNGHQLTHEGNVQVGLDRAKEFIQEQDADPADFAEELKIIEETLRSYEK